MNNQIKKRKLGSTDIELFAIGFGDAPIGDLSEQLNEPTCYKVLENSYNSKINIYDTSPFYVEI